MIYKTLQESQFFYKSFASTPPTNPDKHRRTHGLTPLVKKHYESDSQKRH